MPARTVLVRRQSRWPERRRLDRDTGVLVPTAEDGDPAGTFDRVGRELVAVYRVGLDVFVHVAGRELDARTVRTAWSGGLRRRLRLWHEDELVLDARYGIGLDELLHRASPTAYQDDELHDMGRFLARRLGVADLFAPRVADGVLDVAIDEHGVADALYALDPHGPATTIRVVNRSAADWQVALEPWGDQHPVPSGTTRTVTYVRGGALSVTSEPPVLELWAEAGGHFETEDRT